MKALVMGGTEFVSSSIAQFLISKGYTVDIFTRGNKPVKYKGVRKHLKGDRKSLEDLRANIGNETYDYVFDISAYTKEDVEKLTEVLNGASIKRYVLCSTGGVYIPSDNVESEDFTRGENINWGKYGLDKKEAEDFLFELYETENFPVTMLRPTYIYGEGNNLYREAYLFDRISAGLDFPIPMGSVTTQFIHIDDLVKIFESVVHNVKTIGQAYNVTHPRIVGWQQLLEIAMDVVNKEVKVVPIDSKKAQVHERLYFPFRNVTYMLDIKKLERDGLHVPQIDLEEGLTRAYKWYREVQPQVQDIRMNKMDEVLKYTEV